MSQISNRGGAKKTFGALNPKLMLSKKLKYCLDMFEMVRPGGTVNKNIIKKYLHKPAKDGSQDFIHKSLKGCWGIDQPKWHYQKLKKALVCTEGRLQNIIHMHPDLMIATT